LLATSREVRSADDRKSLLASALCHFVLLTGMLFFETSSSHSAEITGSARVIDGDTIHIGDQRIRLFGIDALEGKQTCIRDGKPWNCGQEATWALELVLADRWVTCEQRDIDRYKRIVAVCLIGGSVDVNEYMVRHGWALAYRQYSKDYVSAEAEAERERVGIWQSKFEKPWDWRRKAR